MFGLAACSMRQVLVRRIPAALIVSAAGRRAPHPVRVNPTERAAVEALQGEA